MPLERVTTPPPHTRPRLCKRCVVSVPRRSSAASSINGSGRLPLSSSAALVPTKLPCRCQATTTILYPAREGKEKPHLRLRPRDGTSHRDAQRLTEAKFVSRGRRVNGKSLPPAS